MIYITVEDALNWHDVIIQEFGGCSGIRDLGLLLSALEMPKATMFGADLHPTIYDKGAAYLFHIISNHPFVDGNKRSATVITLTFFELNDIKLKIDEFEFEEFIVQIASGKKTKSEIAYFLEHGSHQ